MYIADHLYNMSLAKQEEFFIWHSDINIDVDVDMFFKKL